MRPMGPAHRAWLQHWQHIGASSICCPRACVCLRVREWVCVCARTLAYSTPISIICWTPVPLCPLIRLEKTHQMACGEKKIINRQQGKRRHPQPWQGSQRFKAYMTYFEHTNVDTRAHASSCLTCGNGTCWRKKKDRAQQINYKIKPYYRFLMCSVNTRCLDFVTTSYASAGTACTVIFCLQTEWSGLYIDLQKSRFQRVHVSNALRLTFTMMPSDIPVHQCKVKPKLSSQTLLLCNTKEGQKRLCKY